MSEEQTPKNTPLEGESEAEHPGQEAGVDPVVPEADADPTAELKEALLRARAEMDNLEKRTQRELEKARKFMFEGILKDLLPVLDGLDQGLESQAEGDVEGLALTHKLLIQVLARHGLEVIDPQGEAFDPQWHEAMSALPSEDFEPEHVVTVLQKGYRLHDRLLRPARVIIAAEASG